MSTSPQRLNGSSNINGNSEKNAPTNNLKHISIEEYKRLVDCSIELYKANQQIKKLNIKIEKMDGLIEKLKRENAEKTELPHLTQVSFLIFIS